MGHPVMPRRQNLRSIITSMPRVWGLSGLVHGRIVGGNQFQFIFPSEESLELVVRRGPWAFNDRMLILQHWNPNPLENQPIINFIPFWIQICGIPFHYLNREVISHIGRSLGNLLDVDYDAEVVARVEFVRVRVDWDIQLPLRFQRHFQFKAGENTLLRFRYERLRGFCEVCGLLTHDTGACVLQNGGEEQHFDDDNNEDMPPPAEHHNPGVVIREINDDEPNGVLELERHNEDEEQEDMDDHHDALAEFQDMEAMRYSMFNGEMETSELFNHIPPFENATRDIPGSSAHPTAESVLQSDLDLFNGVDLANAPLVPAIDRGKRKREDSLDEGEDSEPNKVVM